MLDVKNDDARWGCRCEACGGTWAERRGNCYEMAARYVLAHGGNLIHGRTHAPADLGPVNHPDLDHAWVEYEHAGIAVVWEPASGAAFPLDYFNLRFRPERFARYEGAKSVTTEIIKHRNWGRWYDMDKHKTCAQCGRPIHLVTIGIDDTKWVTNVRKPRQTWRCPKDPRAPVWMQHRPKVSA